MSGGITITEMLRANGVAEDNLDRAESAIAYLIRRGVPGAAHLVARVAAMGVVTFEDVVVLSDHDVDVVWEFADRKMVHYSPSWQRVQQGRVTFPRFLSALENMMSEEIDR